MLHFQPMQNNLNKMRKEAGYTQVQLAEMLGIATGNISNWETGKLALNRKRVEQLARILNCTEAEIWGYEVAGSPIPIIDWVSAGAFSQSDTLNGSSQDAMGSLLYDGKPNGMFALKVQGGSMNRMAPEGSYIIIDSNDRDLIDGKPYVFSNVTTDETTFKLYKKDPVRLEPHSTENGYETIKITSPRENDEWRIIGRVIEIRIPT